MTPKPPRCAFIVDFNKACLERAMDGPYCYTHAYAFEDFKTRVATEVERRKEQTKERTK